MARKIVLSAVALAASLLCGGVCAAQDAASLIPADAAVVFRMNSGRILDKMGGDEFIAKVMAAADMSDDEAIPAPEECGIDLDKPVYVAVSNGVDVSAAVIMSLSDAGRFERTAQEFCEGRVHRRGDVVWLEKDGRCVVFNSDVAVAADVEGKRGAAWWRNALGRKGSGGGPATEGIRRIMEADADIAVMVSGAIFDGDELSMMKGIYGGDLPMEDISMVWSLSSGRGLAEMRYGVVAESDAAARCLEENTAGMRRVDGRYADCIPASSMLVMYSAIDGAKVSEMLARLPLLAGAGEDEDSEQLRRLVESLSGDIALVMGAPALDGNNVSVPATLMAQVANRELMDFAVRKLGEDVPVEKTDDGYVVGTGGTNIWMSVRGGDMVISTVEGMASLPKASEPSALAGCREGYGAFYLDVKQLLAAAGPFLALLDSGGSVVSLLSRIESVESLAERPDSFRCTVRLCDGEDNIYRILADALAPFATVEDAAVGGDVSEPSDGDGQAEP